MFNFDISNFESSLLSVKKFFEDIKSFKNYYELNKNGDII